MLKCKEIVVYGNNLTLDEKINAFLSTLDDSVEIGDIKYQTTSHKVDMKKKDDEGKDVTVKDYILVHSALIYYYQENGEE